MPIFGNGKFLFTGESGRGKMRGVEREEKGLTERKSADVTENLGTGARVEQTHTGTQMRRSLT